MDEKRLFLLDAYALIYRAYYALIGAPRITSRGLNTSAVFGFCNTLDEILRKENPTHIAVCFDPRGGHTFRHEVYPEYKAGRDKQPEDITNAIPYIKEILAAYRIPAIEVEGYEADDVIGTLAHMASKEGFTTYMMTLDKDYGQLVDEHTLMYRPSLRGAGFEIRGPQQICERYGISSPRQVIDMLALEGDKSDNVPGCPGIGETTASKLIAQWGSVENLIANVDSLKGATKRKIEENAEGILFSKMLVTIRTDVPLPEGTDPESLRRHEVDIPRLKAVYRELEFRTFLSRLPADGTQPGESVSAPPAPAKGPAQMSLFDEPEAVTAPSEPLPLPECRELTDAGAIAAEIDRILTLDTIGLSYSTEGEALISNVRISRIAVATEPGHTVSFEIGGKPELFTIVARLFAAPGLTVAGNNLKPLIVHCMYAGVPFTVRRFDTALAHYLLEPEAKHDTAALTARYFGTTLGDDCGSHADASLRLMPMLNGLVEDGGLMPLLDDIELPLQMVLARMEYNGVLVSTADLATLSAQYSQRVTEMEQEVYRLAGKHFNIGSPSQVGEVLFGEMKIDPKSKRTKKGGYSTTEEILSKYRHDYPIVDLIMKIRALRKLLATYINALPTLIDPVTRRIHTSFNQTVTATGRLSSTNPNLQNIPIRTDDGREIRRAFIPDEGHLMLAADYSQIELRLMANMSGDPDMTEAFLSGNDFHRATAAKIYHEPLEAVTDDQRRHAKTANFGIIYGISAFGLSERLGIPRAEAKQLIDGYFATYPGVRDYINRSIEQAREKGWVQTVMGRRRMLPDINSRSATVRSFAERNAVNAPLQGSAADIIKLAMVRIDRRMTEAGLRSKMLMQVHDELVFDVLPEELEQLQQMVVAEMFGAYHGTVPLEVSVGTGSNWLEAH